MLCLSSNGSGVRHSRHRFYLGDQGLQRLDDPGGPGGNVRFWPREAVVRRYSYPALVDVAWCARIEPSSAAAWEIGLPMRF
jgi:hypothetical protein